MHGGLQFLRRAVPSSLLNGFHLRVQEGSREPVSPLAQQSIQNLS